MGKQSARLYYQGKDHKDIYFQGNYHNAMYVGANKVWEKITGEKYFVLSVMNQLFIVYIDTKSWEALCDGNNGGLQEHDVYAIYSNRNFLYANCGKTSQENDEKILSSCMVSKDGKTWYRLWSTDYPKVMGRIENYFSYSSNSFFPVYDVNSYFCSVYECFFDHFRNLGSHVHFMTGNVCGDAINSERGPLELDYYLENSSWVTKFVFAYNGEFDSVIIDDLPSPNCFFMNSDILYILKGNKVFIYDLQSKTLEEKKATGMTYNKFTPKEVIFIDNKILIYATVRNEQLEDMGLYVYESEDYINYKMTKIPEVITVKDAETQESISINLLSESANDYRFNWNFKNIKNSYFENEQMKADKLHIASTVFKTGEVRFIYVDNVYFQDSEENFAITLYSEE